MPPEYISREEFQNLVDEVHEIRDNHLLHIQRSIDEGNHRLSEVERQVARIEGCYSTMKWFIATGIAIAGLVAALIGKFA